MFILQNHYGADFPAFLQAGQQGGMRAKHPAKLQAYEVLSY
jgi:hypothetical protein